MIIDKYEKEISEAIRILESIRSLSYSSINVYGSSVNEKLFESNYSDIDLIVMCRDFNKLNLLSIVNEITLTSMDFKAKKPIIIEDSLCKRIEFYINFMKDLSSQRKVACFEKGFLRQASFFIQPASRKDAYRYEFMSGDKYGVRRYK